MNILVFSDSHGAVAPMRAAVDAVKPDLVLHLGDYDRDRRALAALCPGLDCRGVRGNCDGPGSPERLLLELGGKKLLLVHGHRQRVKEDLTALYLSAREAGADAALFGHTHIPCRETEGGILLLNPGSIGMGSPPSYALLTIQDGAITAQLRRLSSPAR